MTSLEKLNQYIEEGRLIRKKWVSSDAQGRETACILAALSPEVADKGYADACPADIMPLWLAHLTPWMDDDGSEEAWLPMVKRYAAVAGRWHVLSDETWRKLDYTARRIAVEDCLPRVGTSIPAVEGVLALLRLAEQGAHVLESEWVTAQAAARAALAAARTVARAVALHAVWIATQAAAEAASGAASHTAARASAWHSARWGEAASDRITDAILTSIEQTCDKAEREANNG